MVDGTRSFFHFDLYYEHLPIWQAAQSALEAGQSPYWLDGEYCGHPLLFQQEAPLFYPPTVPLLLTGAPVNRLNDAFTLFHFWLAGLLAYLLLRGLGADFVAALFAGVAWMLSARILQSATWPTAVVVTAYLPAILLGIVRIGRGQRRAGILTGALAGGLAILAARPHALLAAAPLLASVAVAAVATSARRVRAAGDLALAGGLALLIGAPSLLPSALIYPETSRGAGLERAQRDLQALRPGPDLAQAFLPSDGMPRWPEPAAYAGVAVLLLFAAGLVLLARRAAGFPRALFASLVVGGLVGVAFAFGERGPYGLVAWLPPMSWFRVPVRYLLSWSLAAAVGSAMVLAFLLARMKKPAWFGGACLVLLAADLAVHARRAAPTAPAGAWSVEPKAAVELRRRLGTDATGFPRRYLSVADLLYPVYYRGNELIVMLRDFESLRWANGMRWGLESVSGDGPTLRRTTDLFRIPSPRAAALGGVGAVLVSAPRSPDASPAEARSLAIEDVAALPRAILVPESVVVAEEEAVPATLSERVDPRRTAVLEEGAPLGRDPRWTDAAASVRLAGRVPGRVALEATLPAPGILVLFDSWEAGWRATVDGAPAPVLRADAAFRGVRLTAGSHRVEFSYTPRGVREGLGLGAAGLLGLVLVALRLRTGSGETEGLAAPGF
ncbi:MAG TPA: YfhO family protein [Thermoanaerobaculia bacterium]|nr:YfhO family protein [Thermoanaerobaculia bacterium]